MNNRDCLVPIRFLTVGESKPLPSIHRQRQKVTLRIGPHPKSGVGVFKTSGQMELI
jgi:hypothetical protein